MNPLRKFAFGMPILVVAGTMLSACGTTPAGNRGPTFEDYLSIEEAMHNYHYGLENDDNKLRASAFTRNGRIVTVVGGKELMVQYPNQPEKDSGGIPGAPPAVSPSPSGAPVGGPPPSAAGGFQAPKGELWHLPYPGHIKFESATRATYYGYWTSLYAEAKGPRDSQVGSPGHYEDILEKQSDGRWLFIERRIVVGSKK